MGLGDIAVREENIKQFYLPMDVVALKYENQFVPDRTGLLDFL